MDITEEMQAAIDAAVSAATEKLAAKNKELLTEVKTLKTVKTTLEQTAQEAEDARIAATGSVDEVKKSLETKYEREMKALRDQLDNTTTTLKTQLVDNTIAKALVANDVPKHLHEPLTAMFNAKAALKDGVALYGDEPLNDFLGSYFATDAGKAFVSAPQNTGAGATGGTRPSVTGGWTKDNLNATEFSKLANTNPEQANAIAASLGLKFRA
ncbi:hypothetical protein QH494_02535 [Sphingomonas sp. AR_OL41]|uniref:hypothetical protein n=1 Tax=Sphingomonas sp. AR_OL41 TaxID=3042729 RepID=UPI0024817EAD|nr:hypothetical protein [Sphingomonas sp. AR_OL41]MDH7971046.1 hypothetical protein [Sphingomonas sp. AR_OL41]